MGAQKPEKNVIKYATEQFLVPTSNKGMVFATEASNTGCLDPQTNIKASSTVVAFRIWYALASISAAQPKREVHGKVQAANTHQRPPFSGIQQDFLAPLVVQCPSGLTSVGLE